MQLIINGLIAGSLAALMAGGLALVYGVLRVFNLSLGQLALIGGYATWWLHQSLGLPLIVSIVGGACIGGLFSWLAFETVIAPFYKHHRFLPLVTTIALSMVIDGGLQIVFGERPRTILTESKHFLEVWDARVSVEQIILIICTIILLCGMAYILHATSLGRKIRATVQHSDAARSLGISSALLHRLTFIASGIAASLGGIYLGIDQNITPTIGLTITVKAYAALIAGGKENIWGTILCAYLIAMIEQLAVGIPWWDGAYIPAGYQSTVALLCMIILLLIKPAGLFSHRLRTA